MPGTSTLLRIAVLASAVLGAERAAAVTVPAGLELVSFHTHATAVSGYGQNPNSGDGDASTIGDSTATNGGSPCVSRVDGVYLSHSEDCFYGHAEQTVEGYSYADADLAMPGVSLTNGWSYALTILRFEVANRTGAPQHLSLTSRIDNMELELRGESGGPMPGTDPFEDDASESIGARIQWRSSVNGTVQQEHIAGVYGGNYDYTTTADSTMTTTPVESDCYFGFCSRRVWSFLPVSVVTDIGVLAPDDSATIRIVMQAGVAGNPTESAMRAQIGDPLALSKPVLSFVAPTAEVPLPAGIWLGLGGLAALGAIRSRRRG